MKYFMMIVMSFMFIASLEAKVLEKKGFLVSKSCAEAGVFKDCSLDSYVCGTQECFKNHDVAVEKEVQLVLFIHDEGKYYNIDTSLFTRSEFDEGLSRNDVTIVGEYHEKSNTIVAKEFKAPPPPKKSFFKGCL